MWCSWGAPFLRVPHPLGGPCALFYVYQSCDGRLTSGRVESPDVRARYLPFVAGLIFAGAIAWRPADPESVLAQSSERPTPAPRQTASAPATAGRPLARPIHLERISSEDGLSHNTVYAILQDSQGFIWFGTQDGLDRYDGHAFLSYKHDPAHPRSLASSWIGALLEDRTKRLWVGTRAGLHRLLRDGTGFERVTLAAPDEKTPAVRSVTALVEGPDGALWVGTDRGLFRFGPGRDRPVAFFHDPRDPGSLAANLVHAVRIAPDGTPWILTEGPRFQATLNRFSGNFERLEVGDTRALAFTAGGDVWLDPRRPVSPARLWRREVELSRALGITALAEDRGGRLWVGTFDGLFWRTPDDGQVRLIPTSHIGAGNLASEINTIVEDRAGAIWIGSFGGVLRYDPQAKAFDHLASRPGDANSLSSNAVSSVFEDGRGHLWVATYGSGLNEIDRRSGRVVHYRQRAGDRTSLCGDYVWDITSSNRGVLWASTTSGFCRLEDGRFRSYDLAAPTTSPLILREDARGRLWMGTLTGLYLFDPDRGAAALIGDARHGLPQPIDALHIAPDGRVWVASGSSGDLASYDPATQKFAVYRQVAIEGVWDIESARDGAMWLATGSGLTRFDPASGRSERIPIEDKEAGTVFYSLLTDPDGRLWAGTNKGLVRYDPASRAFRRFDLGDGIGSLEFNRHAAFAGVSELFFGGMNGITSLVPAEIRDNSYLPPVVLTAIQLLGRNGERNLDPFDRQELTLSPGDYAVSFDFTALNFTQTVKNRFAYTLEGFDSDWIQAGTRRFARYTNLPPGRYRLRVRGTNNDGVPSPFEASLRVIVEPAFWETWWFRMIAGGLVAGGLFLAYKIRIRRLVELEQLRLRIASDLHDELGSELSGIALASRLVGRHDHLTDKDRSRLADVASAAARITAGLRDIVWYISPEQDTLQSLEQRMRSVAHTMLDGIAHEFHSGGIRPVPLDMDRRRNLFLIYKELLHNVLRHANATRVEVTLDATQGNLRLEVADNGIGMSECGNDGAGLKNIRRRAAELGADLQIESEPAKGTRTCLTAAMTRTRRGRRAADA